MKYENEVKKIAESVTDDIDNLVKTWETSGHPAYLSLYVALSAVLKCIYESSPNPEEAESLINQSLYFSRIWNETEK
jgi:hypothetical protein